MKLENDEEIVSFKDFPVEKLKKWFVENKRDLPWRKSKNPYVVLISEFMLQQTTVSVVIPYFLNWMKKFPSFYDLQKASIEEVLKAWEGLGYYSRARSLHVIARRVWTEFNGLLPEDPQILITFKGIGPYTAKAVALFAFEHKVAPIDGNVLRVMSRFWGIMESIDSTVVKRNIEQLTTAILPDKGFQDAGEGLIELGAMICKKKPLCDNCPLRLQCSAYRTSAQYLLPIRKARRKQIILYRLVMVIRIGNKFFLIKRKKGELMEGLYEFPYMNLNQEEFFNTYSYEKEVCEFLKKEVRYEKHLPLHQHVFTFYKAFLQPIIFELQEEINDENLEPIIFQDLASKVFSAGHRKIVNDLTRDSKNIINISSTLEMKN
ncbi:putative A/G-specific adenine glycosylase YfhQ [Candidatus Clavichlamydia salmonicola]|uniref:A/G-specific adenine glycosylase n=1 Tax=Candidatus Clavichlamydia salmonicola TaxID=469812 RepID=UPI0018919D34|nr:A/G-specific adenine glycosylase [Candidatus Clavichlamydia salmonicola]MBF5051134.1 putative A/G-specific adenine glycosylase YfhQ [Candidatus Clavichlamydia salmonicola]